MAKIKQYSDYWMGSRSDFSTIRTESELIMRLSNIRKGIANFVKIMTNKDIPVKFSSGRQSYTDGETVVISASPNPNHFDSVVGLALHEASHILYTSDIFSVLKDLKEHPRIYLTDTLTERGTALFGNDEYITQFQKHFKLVLNFLEDRKIDVQTYKIIKGYRPYYEALYQRFHYSPMVDEMLAHEKYRVPHLRSYEVHLIAMFNPTADPDALPGLRKIWEIIDLPNIERYTDDPRWRRWEHAEQELNDDAPLIIQDARKILELIYENAVAGTPDENEMGEDESNSIEDPDLDNLDMDDGNCEGEEDSESDMENMRKRLGRLTNGNFKKKALTEEDSQIMRDLETADAELRTAGVGFSKNLRVPVVVYKKLDEKVINSPTYPFLYGGDNWVVPQKRGKCPETVKAIADGQRMGAQLVHRLRIMNDESSMRFSRQDHGRLDKRLIHQIGFSDNNVFAVDHVMRIKPVMVDLSIDSSYSMHGIKWQKAMTLAVALAYVSEKTRSIRIRISIRTSDREACIGLLYDSAVDTFIKIKKFFPVIGPTGGTPEGLAFEALRKELLEDTKNTRRFFVNLSDGEPAFSWRDVEYFGLPAAEHTRAQVKEIRNSGVHVLSYFITQYSKERVAELNENKKTLFHTMYGPDAAFIDTNSVTDIARTLNTFFLQE